MVYIVDDDSAVCSSIAFLLHALGRPSRVFASARSFLEALPEGAPDLLLLDLNMPEMDGADLYAALVKRGLTFPVVVVTAQPDSPRVAALRKAGVRAVLAKPISIDTLESTIASCERCHVSLPGH